jgi:hypothetical protein
MADSLKMGSILIAAVMAIIVPVSLLIRYGPDDADAAAEVFPITLPAPQPHSLPT